MMKVYRNLTCSVELHQSIIYPIQSNQLVRQTVNQTINQPPNRPTKQSIFYLPTWKRDS